MRDLEGRQSAGRLGDRRRTQRWLLASISLALAVVGLSVAGACGGEGQPPSAGPPMAEPPAAAKALGPADAAVTIIEYADFQ